MGNGHGAAPPYKNVGRSVQIVVTERDLDTIKVALARWGNTRDSSPQEDTATQASTGYPLSNCYPGEMLSIDGLIARISRQAEPQLAEGHPGYPPEATGNAQGSSQKGYLPGVEGSGVALATEALALSELTL